MRTVKNVTVLGGHDVFDMFNCDNVIIENCNFRFGELRHAQGNITFKNCKFENLDAKRCK